MIAKKIRIAFLSIHPAPYRDPLLNRLTRTPGLMLEVFTFRKHDQGHDFWKLPPPEHRNTYLPFFWLAPESLRYHWAVLCLVLRRRHDIYVFPGFLMRASITGMLACTLFARPYIYSADSVEDGLVAGGLLGRLKSFLIRRAAFLFVPGKAAEAYFHNRYGVPRRRICQGCYAMDGVRIEKQLAAARAVRAEIRRELGVRDSDTMFLMVANMTKERRYPTTAAGFLAMAEQHPGVRFVMVGSGEDFDEMAALATKHPELIVKQGCSFDEILRLYGSADIYVHGGKEPASTAVVIGALAKLPLLSSFAVGHCWDCLVDGVTGIVVADQTSATHWADGFDKIMANRHNWPAFAQAAREAARSLEVDRAVEAFRSSVVDALANRCRGSQDVDAETSSALHENRHDSLSRSRSG